MAVTKNAKSASQAKRAPPAAKPRATNAPATPTSTSPAWHTWATRPTEREVQDHVHAFFEAIRARDAKRAFALCPHDASSAPYIVAPDRTSIAKAWKLLRRVLTDNGVADTADEDWYSRLAVATVKYDPGAPNVFARMSYAEKPTPLTGLFKLISNDDGWQLTFHMLRVLAGIW